MSRMHGNHRRFFGANSTLSLDSDGSLGMNFRIEGLSRITRVGSGKLLDSVADPIDFDELDRLELDGERLRVVKGDYWASGLEYAT